MAKYPHSSPEFLAPISEEIWRRKYRFAPQDGAAGDKTLDDTFWRVARAAASVEKAGKPRRAPNTASTNEASQMMTPSADRMKT